MRTYLAVTVLSICITEASVGAQNLSIGVVGGGSLTDASQDVTSFGFRIWSPTKDWDAGAMVEWRVRPHFALEADGLYRELHVTAAGVEPDGTLNSVSPSPVVTWEFPILAKYRFGVRKVNPFIEAGPTFRTTGNLNFYPSHYGAAAGLGLETRWRGFTIAPVIRYTRWAREMSNGTYGHLQANQVELLLGFSRTSNRSRIQQRFYFLGRHPHLSAWRRIYVRAGQCNPVRLRNPQPGRGSIGGGPSEPAIRGGNRCAS